MNQREFQRSRVRLEATVYSDHGIAEGQLDDVSLGGGFLRTSARPPVGARCRAFLRMGTQPGAFAVRAQAVVARHAAEGIGLAFTELADDVYEHLRRLVLLNSEDPDRAEDEMQAHLGIRRLGPVSAPLEGVQED